MTFSDSNDADISRGSSSVCCAGNSGSSSILPANSASDAIALRRLSETLESMFLSDTSSTSDFDFFADARLVTACGREIPVHRCILAARSPFLRNMFSGHGGKNAKFELKEWMKDYDVSSEVIVTVLSYLYSGRVKACSKDVCICVDEECSHEACRPAVKFMVEVLYASSVFQVSELVAKFQVTVLLHVT